LRPDDGNCFPAGGSAITAFAIEDDRLVVTDARYTAPQATDGRSEQHSVEQPTRAGVSCSRATPDRALLPNCLDTQLGLPGESPAFGISHLLFAGLMGSVVVVWSLARLKLDLAILGRYDALARLLFALWQIHAVANGATPLLLIFAVFEIVFGIAQALPMDRTGARRRLHLSPVR
jgi:hypothetical protein